MLLVTVAIEPAIRANGVANQRALAKDLTNVEQKVALNCEKDTSADLRSWNLADIGELATELGSLDLSLTPTLAHGRHAHVRETKAGTVEVVAGLVHEL